MYRHGCVTLFENKIQVQYKLFDILEKTSTGARFKGNLFDCRQSTFSNTQIIVARQKKPNVLEINHY